MLPFALPRDEQVTSILVSGRDRSGKSSIAWIDVVIDDPPLVIGSAARPLLEPGTAGAFDESGVSVSWATVRDRNLEVWYHGWAPRRPSGWWNSIGTASGPMDGPLVRAENSSGASFERPLGRFGEIRGPFEARPAPG